MFINTLLPSALTPCPLWWPNVTRLFHVLWSEFPQRETFCWLALPWSWPRLVTGSLQSKSNNKMNNRHFPKPYESMTLALKLIHLTGLSKKWYSYVAASWLQCSLFLCAWALDAWWRTQTSLSLNQGGQGGGETLLLCQSRLTKYVDKFSQFWRVRVWAIQNVCWTFRAGLAVYLRVMWRIPETKLLHKNLRFFVFC